MMATYEIGPVVVPAIANHLWQSTLFAVVAGALTLPLRKAHARARYWLWLAASVKFLIPFSLLFSLGGQLARPSASAAGKPAMGSVVEEVAAVSHLVTLGLSPVQSPAVSQKAADGGHRFMTLLAPCLGVVWLCGFAAVLSLWCIRWRRMSAAVRQATPLREGREVTALRRLECVAGVRQQIEMLLSRAFREPGIFGIFRPILVWPEGISRRLGDAHLESILAHEVWHVRRRDNLAAAMHMALEASFWFHPVVWWLGERLLEERERACDEEVLRLGSPPRVYAESILKACEFSVAWPLACVSGVSGGNLKKRVVRIMTEGVRGQLDARKKALLAAAGFLAVAVPMGLGLAHGQMGPTPVENPLATTAKFEVASIKRNKASGPQMMFRIMNAASDGRFYATGPTVRLLLRLAHDVQDSQVVGGPSWMNSERFDIQAKADSSVDDQLKKLSEPQAKLVKEHMLQELLADRFRLRLHHETRELPIYALVVAKNGPKLEEAKDNASGSEGGGPRRGVTMRSGGGEQQVSFQDSPTSFLATILAQSVGRTVVDRTKLTGRYNFNLHWVPDISKGQIMGGPGPGAGGNEPPTVGAPPAPDSSGPSLFTALQEQLGLQLRSEKGPVDVLVIDHLEEPSEN